MKIVNRGYLLVSPKQPFFDWANEFDLEFFFSIEDQVDPTIYLIEDDFIDNEHIIQTHFKKIFLNELNAITESTEDHPKITEELFYEWFDLIIGTSVFDTLKENLSRFNLDE